MAIFKFNIQLMNPSAMDDAGLLMLDSVREIFDILEIPFESVKFSCETYKKYEDLVQATFVDRKCPIIEFPGDETSHVMVATGIFHTKEGYFVECKDSRREDPNKPPGKIFQILNLTSCSRGIWIPLLICEMGFLRWLQSSKEVWTRA